MLVTIISFIIVFGILVFVHEFGHFIVAKMSGVMVREFSIGMGPKLFYWRHNHTTYTLRLLPIGGYVRLAGPADEDDDIEPGMPVKLQTGKNGEVTTIDLSDKNQLFQGIPMVVTDSDLEKGLWIQGYINGDESEVKRYPVNHDATLIQKNGVAVQIAPADVQFQNAPLHKRLLVNAAGIFNNVLLAIIAYTLLSFVQGGVINSTNQVELSPQVNIAKKAGIKSNSKILAVDGKATHDWNTLGTDIQKHPDQEVTLKVQDGKQTKNIRLKTGSQTSQGKKIGVIGITPTMNRGFVPKLLSGFTQTWNMSKSLFSALWSMVSGHFSLNDLGGPVAIFANTSQAAKLGLVGIISFLAWLSINLAIVNLIPFPALDGGKILLNIIEAIRGKPMSQKVEAAITMAGFVLLMILMVLVTWNDIMRYFIR